MKNTTVELQKQIVFLITKQLSGSIVVSRIISFKPSISGVVTGKFISNGRIFDFEFKGNTTSYKPSGKMVRSDAAINNKATGTRAMPICSSTSYTCKGRKGIACIPLTKTCRQNEPDAIGRQRLSKIKDISSQLAKTFDPKFNVSDGIKESAKKNQKFLGNIQTDIESKRSKLAQEKNKKRTEGREVKPKTENHVLSGNPRYSDKALEKAFSSIDSEGGADRVKGLQNIINKQGLQVVFNDGSTKDSVISNKLAYQSPAISEFKSKIDKARVQAENLEKNGEIEKAGKVKKAILDAEQKLTSNVSNKDKSNGYTSQGYNHVTVKATGTDGKKPFEVSKEDLKKAADVIYNAAETGKDEWSVSNTLRQKNVSLDAAHFVTYLHELGHQIDFISRHATGIYSRSTSKKYATKYSETKPEEWFAEHFALWMLDAKRYEKYDPEGAKIISSAFNQAQSASKRLK